MISLGKYLIIYLFLNVCQRQLNSTYFNLPFCTPLFWCLHPSFLFPSLSLFFFISYSFSLSLPLSLFLFLCFCMSLFLSLYLSLPFFFLSLSLSFAFSPIIFLYFSLSLFQFLFLSLFHSLFLILSIKPSLPPMTLYLTILYKNGPPNAAYSITRKISVSNA